MKIKNKKAKIQNRSTNTSGRKVKSGKGNFWEKSNIREKREGGRKTVA